MLADGYDADERETLCAHSQDSCSTVSLFSTDDASERGSSAGGTAGALDSVTPPLPMMTECNLHASIAVKPGRLDHVHSHSANDSSSLADTVTLKLRWRVYLPSAHPAGATALGRCSLPSSLHTSEDPAGRTRGVLLSAPAYLTYRLPVTRSPPAGAAAGGSLSPEAPSPGQLLGPKMVLALPLGRPLFRQCLAHGSTAETGESQLEQLVEPSISRQHADVTLTFQAAAPTSGSANTAPVVVCRSIDVVDLVSNTTVNGVPLCRHHRYHFPLWRDARAARRSALRGCRRLLSIDLGRHASLEVSHVLTAQDEGASTWAPHDDSHGEGDCGDEDGSPGVGLRRHEEWEVHCASPDEVDRDPSGDAVLVPSKSKSTTPSSAHPTTARSDASRRQPLTARADGTRPRQRIAYPVSAETVTSSVAPTVADTVGTNSSTTVAEDEGSRLLDRLALTSGIGDDALGCPLGHGTAPLPRKPRSAATAHTNVSHVVGMTGRGPISLSPTPSSSFVSTPPSLRNSTWTETFVESFVDHTERAQPVVRVDHTDGDEAADAHAPRGPADGKRIVYTTGLRLSTAEERRCGRLGLLVNPDLRRALRAEVLIVQRPLMRSVKLLTVLPYVRAVVGRQWLDAVLEGGDAASVPAAAHSYHERRSATSIEGLNDFSLAETLRVPPEQRQRLFADHVFFVHRDTRPQEPPLNDLRSVLLASGGRLTRQPRQATVLVLPDPPLSRAVAQQLVKDLGLSAGNPSGTAASGGRAGVEPILVRTDDVFRAVLQQAPLRSSTVTLSTGRATTSQGADTSSRRRSGVAPGRRSTPAARVRSTPKAAQARRATTGERVARKTPRASSRRSAQRPRPSTSSSSPSRRSARKE